MPKQLLSLNVNGRAHEVAAPGSALLLEVLRDELGLSGTKQGCDGGECGACTVLIDGRPILSCLTLAASIEGSKVETVESLACYTAGGELHPALRIKPGDITRHRFISDVRLGLQARPQQARWRFPS